MRPIPLPVRVAAGLVVTALEQARRFPEQLAELPVTAASRAVQAGMLIQQRVTALAIKGDEVFALLRPVEDTPPWARFDEDEAAPEPHDPDATDHSTSRPGPTGNGSDRGDADAGLAAVVAGPGAAPGRAVAARSAGPPALPGYDEMSLAQLRGKLRALSLLELEALLEHEHAHQDRAPFVTLLSNRIVTVRSR